MHASTAADVEMSASTSDERPVDLYERDESLDAARSLVHRVGGGDGGALFVVGEPGLGKTSVLDRARAESGSLDIAAGSGAEMEEALPFGLLAQVLDDLGTEPPGLPDGVLQPAVEPSAPHHRVLRWLQGRGRDRPLLLVLDDLHWADHDSLGVFAFLARRLDRLPVGLIAALRPWPREAYDECCALVGAGHAQMVQVAPLSRPAADRLLTRRVGADVAETTQERAWQLCQGNPLLVEQVALALGKGEDLPEAGQEASALAGPVLLARFAGLDRQNIAYASAASVLGMSFDTGLVSVAAGFDGPAADHAAEALFRNGLVRSDEDGTTRFAHQLLAQALYDDLAPPVRRRLHGRYFELLAARGLENEASEHAMRARLAGYPAAAALLQRTGQAALATGAVATAIRHLEGAVQAWGDCAPASLQLALSHALAAGGRAVDAAEVCARLLDDRTLDWTDRVAALRISGRSLYFTGTPDHGEAQLEQASALAAEHDPAAAVEPLLDQSLCAWLSGGPARALSLAVKARTLAAGADDRLREWAGATWGHLAYEAGDPAGLNATDEIGRRLDRDRDGRLLDPADLAWPWAPVYQFAMNENYAGRYARSQAAFSLAADAMERAGAVNALATVHIHLANVTTRRGLLDDALRHASLAEEFAELTPAIIPYARLVQAEALLWRGRFVESEACCRAAEGQGAHDWFARLWLAYVRGVRLLWQGDKAASDLFLLVEDTTAGAGIREPCHILWGADAVAAHLGAGREADASR
ncbi:MAG: ATP-binding protein, partial [Acidimicrobiales bacterium]